MISHNVYLVLKLIAAHVNIVSKLMVQDASTENHLQCKPSAITDSLVGLVSNLFTMYI